MLRRRLPLAALLALAAVLNLWALSRNGFANDYYSAAVRAMSTDWHDFLYGSFDASGVMTVDKPPLALWVQALSARVFGFSSLSLLVPQALMGVGSVWLVFDLVRRRFGDAAGLAGGLVLALTPMTVAISRHNNPDALLILCSLAALWFVVRGLEDGRVRWLLLAGLMVGLGFETKMAAALLVVPGLAAAWLWVAPLGRVRAAGQLAAGGAVMAVVGLAWPVLMWLTPAADRPWISGTSDNSIWSLIAGYNGAGRLAGQAGGPAGQAAGPGAGAFGGGGPGGGGGMGGVFGGDTGPLRLLDSSLGGQAGWLLGFALVAGVAVLVASRLRRGDARTGWLIATGGAFLTCAVAFSAAEGIFHPYYVSLLAPFTAALVGAGVGQLVEGDRVTRVLGPVAVLAGVGTELFVLDRDATGLGWAVPLVVVVGVGAAVALALALPRRLRLIALGAGLAALLAAPATWAAQTLGHATSGTFPAGGPADQAMGGGPGGRGGFRGRPPGFGAGAAPGAGGQLPPAGAGGFGGPGAAGGATPGGATPGGATPGGGSGSGGLTGALGRAAAGALARGGFPGGGGMFGAGVSDDVIAYVRAHGGGTIGVSSQSSAARTVLDAADKGVTVAGIGGFSGRESQVSPAWLAGAVQQSRIRWVLPDGSGAGAGRQDGRVGANDVMAAAKEACTAVDVGGTASSTTTTLYDCRGKADALRASA